MPNLSVPKVSVITLAANNTAQKIFPSALPKTNWIKLFVPSANTAQVFYGDSTVHAGNVIGVPVAKGAIDLISVDGLISAESLFVSGTLGDKINVMYMELK